MILEEQEARVFQVLRDASKRFITGDMVEDWLNEAQRDISRRLRQPVEERVLTFVDGQTALDEDVTSVLSIEGGVQFTIADQQFQGTFVTGGTLRSSEVGDGDATVTVSFIPPDLDAPQDESVLPVWAHDKMVDYARAQGLFLEREDVRGDFYMARYEADLPPASGDSVRQNPGPLVIGYEPTPWDRDASHRG